MWQDISTAPKQVFDDKLMLFCDGESAPIFVEWCEDGADEDGNHWSGFVEIGDGAAPSDRYEPTMWMLIPAPSLSSVTDATDIISPDESKTDE